MYCAEVSVPMIHALMDGYTGQKLNKKHRRPRRRANLQVAEPRDFPIPAPPYQVITLNIPQVICYSRWNVGIVAADYNFIRLETHTPLLGRLLGA